MQAGLTRLVSAFVAVQKKQDRCSDKLDLAQPVLSTVLGLCLIAITVLVLPFLSKKIEENLEPFFLLL